MRSSPPVSNTPGPIPTVTVSLAAGSPSASPVSRGGTSTWPATVPVGLPAVMSRAPAVQVPSSSRRSVALSETRSKEAKTSRAWAGVATPA